MLVSLLNYGAEAQKYTDYSADSLVNEGVAANGVFDAEAITSVKGATKPLGDSGAKFVGLNVRFDNVNRIRFDFTPGTSALSDLTITVNSTVYTEEDFIANENGTYSIYSEAIFAGYFNTVYTAELSLSGEVVHSATYSINSYVKSMYKNERIGELAKAIYFYGVCSENFINVFSEKE